jgi:hypothetical protein
VRRVLSRSAQIRTHPARQSSYLLVVVAGAGFAGALPPLVAEPVTHANRLARRTRYCWRVGDTRSGEMRQLGRQRNRQAQVEVLVRLLLEPVGRRQRRKVLGLLSG